MATSSGNSTWSCNSKGELTQFASPQGTISYAYDAAGRLTSYTDAAGTTSLTYDNASRVTSLVNPFSETTSWVYDAASRVTRQNFGNGAYETYSYDTRSRLTSVVLKNSGGATLSSHSYGYDAASQITSRTDDGVVTTFVYDAIGQLLSETKAGYAASYTYDANGNRLTKTLNGVPEYYTYDSADKLLSAGGKTYGYDAAGRVTSVTSSGQVTSLTYDYEDRVTSIAYPGGGANTFAYSGLGARVSKTDSTGSYTYRRNGSSVTSPVLSDGPNVYTPGISERRSGVSKFYHSDLKNGVQQTDSSQTFAAVRAYDAFGMPVSSSGAWAGPFGYGGKFGYQSDPDSGLMLLGHRYYDPSTGRFLTRDPIKDGRNWYVYCGNNPVSFADPLGLGPMDVFHTVLDWFGVLDPTPVCDLTNAIAYALEGQWEDVVISLVAIIPLIGDLAKLRRVSRAGAQVIEQLTWRQRVDIGHMAHSDFERFAAEQGWETGPRAYLFDDAGVLKGKPDARKPDGTPVELKPDTRRGRKQGRRQAAKYERLSGMPTELWKYDPSRYPRERRFELME
ncbi:MAG: hypothetical protein AKCLJLPJ_00015 [Fimbriimonadales bacterium]|nr:hypothetical protein [Fimbriimonadales bacterium]